MQYTDGFSVVEINSDTWSNYNTVCNCMPEHMSGEDMLRVLTNLLGLQILDETTTGWILEEFGYESVDD